MPLDLIFSLLVGCKMTLPLLHLCPRIAAFAFIYRNQKQIFSPSRGNVHDIVLHTKDTRAVLAAF